jgi:hypothetical protein
MDEILLFMTSWMELEIRHREPSSTHWEDLPSLLPFKNYNAIAFHFLYVSVSLLVKFLNF